MRKDLYEILGVSRGASTDEIKARFRLLLRGYNDVFNNPDKASAESKRRLREIIKAGKKLSDPKKRKKYDKALAEANPQMAFKKLHRKLTKAVVMMAAIIAGLFYYDDYVGTEGKCKDAVHLAALIALLYLYAHYPFSKEKDPNNEEPHPYRWGIL